MAAIPVIDLAAGDAAVAAAVRGACETAGFFYIVNHGVPEALVRDQFAWAERFFELPLDAKQAVALSKSAARRGWEGVGSQTLDEAAKPDLKESYYCGVEYPPEHPYVRAGHDSYGANCWPDGLPGFGAQMTRYIDAVLPLGERLFGHLARSLDLPVDWFCPLIAQPMITLRLVRYPPHPADAPADLFGAGAHTDWGAVTILAQDALGGLDVCLPDGSWVAAPPIAGSFVVNLGDMVPRWTNGRYRSNRHRVRNTMGGGRLRHSIPLFFSPDYTARITCAPTCLAAGETPLYPPCTAGEHLHEMYLKTYGLAAE
jgi:isopenicillin N synthase-like dioxygenase